MDRRIKVSSQPDPAPDAGEELLAFVVVPVPAYHPESCAGRDPETVCHRTITGDPAYYPQAEFHGRTIYFCTETCHSVFLSDPERFYVAHSKRRP
jgi:YHS domain-containing protein